MPLDIAIAIFLSMIASDLFQIHLIATTIFISIGIVLMPDIDAIPELWQRGKLGGKKLGVHRELTHYPLIYIVVIPFLFQLSHFWTFIYITGTLGHFIHDSLGTGWGIQWLYPFGTRYYKFFSSRTNELIEKKKFVQSWSEKELPEIMQKYGNENWFRDYYLRLSSLLIVETTSLLISLIALYFYLSRANPV